MSDGDEELAKDLGLLSALTIGIGTMIGAGIFVLPGEAANAAGPAVALSFVVGGGISLLTGLSASELGTAMPKAGGGYYYVNHALGPLFGSVAGWGNWIGLAFASAFYTLGFGSYLNTFVALPALGLGPVGLTPDQVGGLLAGLAFIAINYIGAKETGSIQVVIVTLLVGILTLFSILGFLQADLSTIKPFFPRGAGAVLPATGLIFVSYLGFAQITTVAEELKNPGRNLPLAVVGSVVIVTTMYAVIMVVLMGVVNWRDLVPAVTDTPVLDVAEISFGAVGLAAVGVGLLTFSGLLATASSANASILASSRINFAMGRDRLVSNRLNAIHPSFGTPYRSIAVTGAFIVAFILYGDVNLLAKAGSVLHLVVYGLLNVGLIVMREADVAEYDPDFEVPLYPVVPVLGALSSFGLIVFMDPLVIGLALLFVLGGAVWYAVYARTKTDKTGVLSEYILSRPDEMPGAAVSAASSVQPDGTGGTDDYRVLVPLANPKTESDLITLASAIAKQRGGTVDAVHIVTAPDQTSLQYAVEHPELFEEGYHDILDEAKRDAETFGVDVETHTVVAHHLFEQIFDTAEQHGADVVVMGWEEDTHGSPGRVESAFEELTDDLPCDFLVLRDRGFDPSEILVPTAGGPDSDLSAEIAKLLRAEYGSTIRLLHVADDQAAGRAFLEEWADGHGLGDAELVVESGEVETVIEEQASESSMLVLGATERGLLSRLVRGTLVLDVVDDVPCSVLLAERAREKGFLDKLVGR